MVNRLLRNKIAPPEPDRLVRVFNRQNRDAAFGIHTLKSNEWTPVPESLARRLVDDANYDVEDLMTPIDFTDPSLSKVWRNRVPTPEIDEWPKVAVIVPVYNAPDLLNECADSLCATQYDGDVTVVFVDNASTDPETQRILADWSRLAGYKVLRNDKPQGFAATVNKGIASAPDADFYVLFNQDCVATRPDWLVNLIGWMLTRSDCGVAGAKLIYPDKTIQHAGIDFKHFWDAPHRFAHMPPSMVDANYHERMGAVTGAVFCIRAATYRGIGPLDENYLFSYEDIAYCLHAIQCGWEVWYVPTCEVMHREGAVRIVHDKFSYLKRWIEESTVRFEREYGEWVRYYASHPLVREESERERWLSTMGWQIPKDEVRLPEPSHWPSVGIVVPVYDAPQLLDRCIEGLRETHYKGKWRTRFVDNASTDKETIRTLGWQETTRFDKPVGFSEAVNAGIKALGTCDYYVLFNQDVAVCDPDWLEHLVRWMEWRKNCAIAGPKLLYENGTIENAGILTNNPDGCRERGRNQPEDAPEFNHYRKVPAVSGAVFCVRGEAMEELGMFDERYLFGCEDLVYCLRASAEFGREVWYVPDSVLIHSSHAVQQANPSAVARVRDMHRVSRQLYDAEWGDYRVKLCDDYRVAFVLPDFGSASGGARVVGALARQLSVCGVRAEVYARDIHDDPDTEFPHFSLRPLSDLKSAKIVIATRFDTLEDALRVNADRRLYLVQQIEDVMAHDCNGTKEQALASYRDLRFEIITIGEHLASRLAQMGRSSTVCDVGFYRDMYPCFPRSKPTSRPRILMYGIEGYKGPDQPAIAAQIRRLVAGVEVNSFHRFGPVPKWADNHYRPQTTSDVADLYREHDIYVYASESDGFAMTPVEAMACGTPVVLTDFPGKDQYARDSHNCLIVPFRDAEAVGLAVKRLLDTPALWKRLAENGPKTADRYDWRLVGAQYARVVLGAPDNKKGKATR